MTKVPTSYTADLVTNAGGAATATLGSRIRGELVRIFYDRGDLDEGATLKLVGATTGQVLFEKAGMGTADAWLAPLAPAVKSTDGGAFTDVGVPVLVFAEAVTVTIASGGNVTSGAVTIWVLED